MSISAPRQHYLENLLTCRVSYNESMADPKIQNNLLVAYQARLEDVRCVWPTLRPKPRRVCVYADTLPLPVPSIVPPDKSVSPTSLSREELMDVCFRTSLFSGL